MSKPDSGRRRPPPRPVEVVRTERVGASVQRITFGGPALEGFEITMPTGHIKVFLPGGDETEPALPTFGPDGPVVPEDRVPPVVRTYTPRRFSAERRELEVEFFLHGTGPASTWAEHAAVGDRAAIAGQGRGYDPDPTAAWFVFAGDETAIPALCMLVEALPDGIPATVIAEVESEGLEQDLPSHPAVTTIWLHRDGLAGGEALQAAIEQLPFPHGDGRVWVATEAGAVRRIRAHLLGQRQLPASSVVTRGLLARRRGQPP